MKLFNRIKNKLIKGFILLFLLIMFLFPNASYQGASSGLLLWFQTVLPTLLPFIIISNLMIRLNITKQISKLFYPVFHRIFHVSHEGCYPVLIGFLSGIPMGAKATSDLVTGNRIDAKEGQFLLSMCNNASPMFIMSYIAISQLKLPRIKYALYAIIYCSAIISALVARVFVSKLPMKQKDNKITNNSILRTTSGSDKSVPFRFEILDNSILNGFEVITKIGGYIILFSILAQIVNQIGPQTTYLKALIMGFLEITTGVNQVCKACISINKKIILVAVLTSFGGLSGMAQTKSVLGSPRLSIKSYFVVKLISSLITLVITLLYVSYAKY